LQKKIPLYYLDPFGCVKNQVDAENMMANLNETGWAAAGDAETADLIIVNSCGFIESAKQESINAVLGWRKLYPEKKILLAGCLSQRYAQTLTEALPEADGFFGIEDISRITEAAATVISKPGTASLRSKTPHAGTLPAERNLTSAKQNLSLSTGKRPLLSMPGSAYVKISEGCNNNCSYCAIPLIRGRLKSREIVDILEECRILIHERGIREICIIGQDIGSYGKDCRTGETKGDSANIIESNLPQLLKRISLLKGDFWVRLLYIHPDNFPLEILDIMEQNKRFLPYFDIPFQHSSAKILTAMNRCTTQAKVSPQEIYLELLKTIRSRLPDAVIRSTFLLGFPGETEEDFTELLDFQQKANLDWAGCFVYSREEGTPAYSMKGKVSKKIKNIRKQQFEEKQIAISEKNIERFIGRKMDMLIEEAIEGVRHADANSTSPLIPKTVGSYEESFLLGRLYCHAPDIDGAAVLAYNIHNERIEKFLSKQAAGTIIPVRVIGRSHLDLLVNFETF